MLATTKEEIDKKREKQKEGEKEKDRKKNLNFKRICKPERSTCRKY